MNSQQITEREAIHRYTRVFVAQYLSTVHSYDSFQNEAINLLTTYLLQIIRRFANEVKKMLTMQGRNLPNALHLLVVNDQLGCYDLQKLLRHMIKRRDGSMDIKSLQVIEKLGRKMFENDLETINMYEKEKQYPNIRYVKPIYLINPNKNCLPYFQPIEDAFQMPPELSYRQTNDKIRKEHKNIEHLLAYTKRENKKAIMGMQSQRIEKQKEQGQVEEGEKVRRAKFSAISFL